MATIGTFTANENGFTGSIRTLALNRVPNGCTPELCSTPLRSVPVHLISRST